MRDLAAFGIAFSAMQEHECFVQMNDVSNSPDAFLMVKVNEDTNEIAPVELTIYARSKVGLPDKSLLEKLTEKHGKFQKLPIGYFLLIHLGIGLEIDYDEIHQKLREISPNFFVFSIQEISNHPDTIARVVSYYPKLDVLDINIGAICDKLSKGSQFGVVFTKRGCPPK